VWVRDSRRSLRSEQEDTQKHTHTKSPHEEWNFRLPSHLKRPPYHAPEEQIKKVLVENKEREREREREMQYLGNHISVWII
jgi:uncharacterized Zn finger protein